jgi:hypothetical protein
VAPLLTALRPELVAVVTRQLGIADLTELPFYDMDLALDGGADELAGRYVLHYLNRTGRELKVLPLLLHANSPRELGGPTSSALVEVTAVRALQGPAASLRRVRLTLNEVEFARPVKVGERIQLQVEFSGKLRHLPPGSNDIFGQALGSLGVSSSGAGASDYGLLASGDGIFTVASAYPVAAPYRQGAFDVDKPSRFGDLAYNELCNFRVRVAVPSGYVVATNLREAPGTKRTPSGTTVYTALGAANRDFVLVAGRDLRRATGQVGAIRVTSIFKRGDERGGQLALKTGLESLRLFQERYGPYPYSELDITEATLVGGAGGVEFPGMVLIAGMLYQPPSKSTNPLAQLMRLLGGLGGMLGGGLGGEPAGQSGSLRGGLRSMDTMVRELTIFTVAHEVAHQYFAGLVGADCRHHPAMDEPLAQFAAGEYVKHTMGAAAGERVMSTNVKLNYGLYRLLGGKDQAAAQPVQAFSSALAYAGIVYGKAPYFYEALRRRLGAARLAKALRAAVDESRFKLVTLDEWLSALEHAAGGPASGVRALGRHWLYERHGDADLDVDEGGEKVLETLLGKEAVAQLSQSLGLLGMKPRDLFRMLLGNLAGAEGGTEGAAGDVLKALEELQKLGR